MEFIIALWLPILLSAVLVFVASSILHMVIPFHKGDYGKLDNEDTVLEALRSAGPGRGTYMFPCPGSMKEMSSPEMVRKYEQGPVGHLTILPSGVPKMGKSLLLWFLYCVIVGLLTAYVAWHGLAAGAPYLSVFRLTGAAALLGYAVGSLADSIWKGQAWTVTGKFLVDGAVYALVTAGTFGWLWPEA